MGKQCLGRERRLAPERWRNHGYWIKQKARPLVSGADKEVGERLVEQKAEAGTERRQQRAVRMLGRRESTGKKAERRAGERAMKEIFFGRE
ncbi:hypothetical protein CDL15_Pgr001976 [Punica granatum]|uniref:Uncharacterized protein n=1 Tax=Punica granatum TaxID=22663 RepID=A0A218XDH9_PUNGR|nr:hypothetical protein CDL15_Pgr001976 [Punica granatum]PKI65165.1 hypothetical protein CRG98_014479 [Punica granatum]